jgi:hypothetical protein
MLAHFRKMSETGWGRTIHKMNGSRVNVISGIIRNSSLRNDFLAFEIFRVARNWILGKNFWFYYHFMIIIIFLRKQSNKSSCGLNLFLDVSYTVFLNYEQLDTKNASKIRSVS